MMTLYMQNGLHFSALQAGLAFVPLAIVFTVASRRAATRVARLGVRALIEGCVIALAGLALLGGVVATDHATLPALILPLVVFGLGQGLVMAPLFATVLGMVPRMQAGAGAGMLATVQQSGNATGVAILGALYFAAAAQSIRAAMLVSLIALAAAIGLAILCLAMFRAASAR